MIREDIKTKEISIGLYNIIIGLTLLWGFSMNWFFVTQISTEAITSINPLVFFIGYFISCLAGVFIYNTFDEPLISFLGYNLIVLPFGFILNIIISGYSTELVKNAFEVTGSLTVIMMCLGAMFPRFFKGILPILTITLIIGVVVELIMVFVFHKNLAVIDYIFSVVFCGYIGYSWGKAMAIPKTVDNAIDSAASLYMNIINLFIRILRIMSRR